VFYDPKHERRFVFLTNNFDLPALVDVAQRARRRELRLVTVDTTSPSPFAASLLFGYVANYLYEGDAPLAERRAHALTVDPRQLRELLGEAELRELLDARVLDEAERVLQALDAGRRAKSADRLHDLLLRLGDLRADEIAARCEPSSSARAWVDALVAERRIVRVALAGEERLAAIEDVGRWRDALGVPPPPGVPHAFLEPVPDALGGVHRDQPVEHHREQHAERFGVAGEEQIEVVHRPRHGQRDDEAGEHRQPADVGERLGVHRALVRQVDPAAPARQPRRT